MRSSSDPERETQGLSFSLSITVFPFLLPGELLTLFVAPASLLMQVIPSLLPGSR